MADGLITHIEIPADDPDRAQRFYHELVGWQFMTIPEFPDYFMFRPGGDDQMAAAGAIGKRGVMAPEQLRDYINVDSIDELAPKIEGLGGTIVQPKVEVPGQGWFLVFRDTEGNELGLWENAQR